MSAHTAAPWKVRDRYVVDARGNVVATVTPNLQVNDLLISYRQYGEQTIDSLEAADNAALIAAAPKLLEELRGLVNALHTPGQGGLERAIRSATVAIAKATGESNDS